MGAVGFLSWRPPGSGTAWPPAFWPLAGCAYGCKPNLSLPHMVSRAEHYLAGKVIQGTIAVLLTWGIGFCSPAGSPCSLPAAAFPNHTGLLRATAIVTALFLCAMGIWCLQLRKKAGKEEALDV